MVQGGGGVWLIDYGQNWPLFEPALTFPGLQPLDIPCINANDINPFHLLFFLKENLFTKKLAEDTQFSVRFGSFLYLFCFPWYWCIQSAPSQTWTDRNTKLPADKQYFFLSVFSSICFVFLGTGVFKAHPPRCERPAGFCQSTALICFKPLSETFPPELQF